MKGKKVIYVILAVLAALVIWIIASMSMSSGFPNLVLRNALAFDKNIEDPGFTGESYEHIPYSDVSASDYLDLYVPEADGPMPLLILVHGGGFVENDSQSRQATLMYQYMRANGYAVATINYRLAQEATYPAAVCDVKAAVRYLRANADQYGYDPDRFAIWGESAGGYLACMAALTGDGTFEDVAYIGEDEENRVSGEVTALIDFYGILDFDKVAEDFQASGVPMWLANLVGGGGDNEETSVMTQFLGRPVSSLTEEELQSISPTYYASLLEPDSLKIYIEHGSVDITVARAQSWRLRDVATESLGAANVTFREMKNFKHADDKFYTPEALGPVKEFLDSVF